MGIEKVKNCPNCGGILNDSGCCLFCGSRVYDFADLYFTINDKPIHSPVHIGITDCQGKTTFYPAYYSSARFDFRYRDDATYVDFWGRCLLSRNSSSVSISLSFYLTGNPIENIVKDKEGEVCPNCGGHYDSFGRCTFCGSKVYHFSFIPITLSPWLRQTKKDGKQYIRARMNNEIIQFPVKHLSSVERKIGCSDIYDELNVTFETNESEITREAIDESVEV